MNILKQMLFAGIVVSISVGSGSADSGNSFDSAYTNPILSADSVSVQSTPTQINTIATSDHGDKGFKKQLFHMAELLRGLPAARRIEFLGSIQLLDGRVAGLNPAPLLEDYSRSRIDALLDVLRTRVDLEPRTETTKPRSLVRLSDLLSHLPASAQQEFLDSLVFRNGGVAGVSPSPLRKYLNETEVKRILDSIAPVSAKPQINTKLCGDGWCDKSQCGSSGDNIGCWSGKDVCYDWCTD